MEYLNRDRLQQIAKIIEQPVLLSRALMPALHWDVDEVSGRPIGRWVVVEGSTYRSQGSPLV